LQFHEFRQFICRSGFSRDCLVVAHFSQLKPLLQPFLQFGVFLALLLLSACGFHLRGVVDFPPDVTSVYVQAEDHYSPFYRELVAKIRASGLGPSSDPGSADAIIRVLQDETGHRALTVSARNVPREFEVYYLVNCSASVHGREVVNSQQFILVRDYTYDETKVLGKANEEDVLTNVLAENLVGLLVQTISAGN